MEFSLYVVCNVHVKPNTYSFGFVLIFFFFFAIIRGLSKYSLGVIVFQRIVEEEHHSLSWGQPPRRIQAASPHSGFHKERHF